MSALPRGACPVCGADVAVRRNGETRQHDRWETFATATGLDGRRRATCPGTGQPSKTAVIADRWCESCECWSSTTDTTCPVHQTPTETAEQIRRERDALRADCARISEELDLPPAIGPAPGEIRRLRDLARDLTRERDALQAHLDLLRGDS